MKIMVVCGNGLGSSLMMEMSLKTILKDLNVDAEVDHTDLGSAKGTQCEIFVGTKDIAEQLQSMNLEPVIVSLDNMVDKSAMKERLSEGLKKVNAL